ncbi:flt3-interacting zinc finger protein 1-like [Rhinatrema bivittatum]|uniref:flt3-interacting zinc finger protein 1-like n=1 Tax=Rhinatrema bivittatum TaxID=194408 RepID=UPI00112C98CF|nr:flt3-interacting zinc finger protein 1-like [Rhinatrema bivittatum]XP_029440928.1 flt3-interacting zinc finger protein 1-like [Rhinatrema bivittatum]XP_029440929.1 flt3-interacting zinc finger protein 1-like [Rhinatrema bivittatum]
MMELLVEEEEEDLLLEIRGPRESSLDSVPPGGGEGIDANSSYSSKPGRMWASCTLLGTAESDPEDEQAKVGSEVVVAAAAAATTLTPSQPPGEGADPFQCSACDKSFRFRSGLRRHFASHTQLKPFGCPHCGKNFKHSFNLANHIRCHTGERPYLCTQCPKSFRDSTSLLQHQVVHTGEKPYICHVCHLRFSLRNSLRRHLNKQHQVVEQATSDQEKSEESPAPVCAGRLGPYGCGACGRHFQWLGELRRHWLAHSGAKPFKCPECERNFNTPSLLERHRLTHGQRKQQPSAAGCQLCAREPRKDSGSAVDPGGPCAACAAPESLYQCECGTFFSTATALAQHLDAHASDVSFICGTCGQSLPSLSSLEDHQRGHSAHPAPSRHAGSELLRLLQLQVFPPALTRPPKKPFGCSECDKLFRKQRDLDRHLLVHTGEKPYQCKECGKFFRQETYLKHHQLLHGADRPFPCSICGKGFITLSNLSRHEKLHQGLD